MLRSPLDSSSEALKAKLDQVRGCVEMSVKIIWEQIGRATGSR